MALPIILDCDPGHDDAIALLLALASPELDLLGVTVTHGNVGLPRTLANALLVRELAGEAGARVPVYAGAWRPLIRPALHATHVHGESGLGDVKLPPCRRAAESGHAAQFMIDAVCGRPGEVTLVATGPLTNLALALRLDERFARDVREVVLMGGSADWGNASPAAEFNFFADPHAARVVFESGVKITMFGLNASRQVPVDEARVQQLQDVNSNAGRVASRFLEDYLKRVASRGRQKRGALHDPCTVAFLLQPELFGVREMFVQIDDREGPNFGRSSCDVNGVSGEMPNAFVAMQADADGFYTLLSERLARLP
ncbi:nucleoside hydrolase [Deinococcus peraridilitoris]|uniref:Inosine-uridine nucleoside N-ribohydrolase n=1 Tax=Deinococcus peraridilitoris (strain DSM 19664 / LMG 22246 / CIP 109416 / KR-200) TaxID=937777 RepID=L0A1G4_DEIPD|nr:nucleoside hydrolase [Deinococcus peraridilitoris]AFZ67738.1 Inosine-uridine nucleoside N-ribohydrolase [Deinococcus peraridilitoris DSM 19664]